MTTWLLWLNMVLTGSMLMIRVSPKDSYCFSDAASAEGTASAEDAGASALMLAAYSNPAVAIRQTAGNNLIFLFIFCSPCTDQISRLTFM